MNAAMTRRSAAVLAVLALLCGSTHRASADDLKVIRPNRPEMRELYSLLQQDWWNWAASLPAENHPLADKTGENCDAGQDENNDVFFLGGTHILAAAEMKHSAHT